MATTLDKMVEKIFMIVVKYANTNHSGVWSDKRMKQYRKERIAELRKLLQER